MIRFFRHFSKFIRGQDRGRVLWYILGEVLLVMVGILLALQVNNWNEDRLNRVKERKILYAFNKHLTDDLENLKFITERMFRIIAIIRSFKTDLDSGNPYPDSLEIKCGALYGLHLFSLNHAPYRSLGNMGLDLIRDEDIKNGIINIYETHDQAINWNNEIDMNVTFEFMRPYFMKNFRNIEIMTFAQPIERRKVLSDQFFYNMVDYRLDNLSLTKAVNYPTVIADIEILLGQIEQYLGNKPSNGDLAL